MDDSQLNEYAAYWGDEAEEFLLVSSGADLNDLSDCLIFHKESRCYDVIEDDEVSLEVKNRMREAGVPVVHMDDLNKPDG